MTNGDAEERATFTDPLDRFVFATVPVATAAGITTMYLLEGTFEPRDGGTVEWAQLLAVDAAWGFRSGRCAWGLDSRRPWMVLDVSVAPGKSPRR